MRIAADLTELIGQRVKGSRDFGRLDLQFRPPRHGYAAADIVLGLIGAQSFD